MKIHVQLNYGLDADLYAARYAAGLTPDLAPYGFHHAQTFEAEVTYSNDRKASRIWNTFRRGIKRVCGFDLLHAWHNRHKIFAADVVWTMIDSDYLAVAALRLLKGSGPCIIGNNVWLFEHSASFGPVRRWLYRRLIRQVDLLTVHSKTYLPVARAFVPDAQTELMLFGISGSTFTRTEPPARIETMPIRILAAGNDPTRDWSCALAAFGGDARFEVVIVSDKVTDAEISGFDNVRLPRRPTISAFKDLYLWADLVVVPMIDNKYSGITVALEAAAMGRCVLSSRTGGVPTYFDEGEVLYCAAGDPDDMRKVALKCCPDQRRAVAARSHARFLRDGYTTERMIERYYEASRRILASRDCDRHTDALTAGGA